MKKLMVVLVAGKPVELQNAAIERLGADGVPVGWSRRLELGPIDYRIIRLDRKAGE